MDHDLEAEKLISFCCNDCGQMIKVSPAHAGKKGKCPKCRSVVVIPLSETVAGIGLDHKKSSKEQLVRFSCVMCNEPISVSQGKRGEIVECPNCGSFAEVPVKQTAPKGPEKSYESEVDSGEKFYDYTIKSKQQDDEYSGKRKLPWFLDIFLYPLSTSGLINLGIFIFFPLVTNLLSVFLFPLGLVFWGARFILGLYFCWYVAECVRDSAMGAIRAPSVMSSNTDDFGGMLSEYFNLIACFFVCFGPPMFYLASTGRQDAVYWGLIGYSSAVFPLLFLSILIIDSNSSWNPIMLIASFFKLLPQYAIPCGVMFGFLSLLHVLPVVENPILSCLTGGVMTYMIFVAAHLLGRFYWLNTNRLDW